MSPTVILPYTAERTTAQDIDFIVRCLNSRDPSVRLLSFDSASPPIALANPFPPQTITVTLNNNKPSTIFDFIPGPKFFAPPKSKSQLLDDLIKAGIPMPHTETFSPDNLPDEAKFGPYVAIKTTAPGTAHATGIHVFCTAEFADLRDQLMALYENDMIAGHMPVLQQYVRTGPKPIHTRVSTFLGDPIVCFQTIAPNEFCPHKLKGLASGEATSNFSTDRTRVLKADDEMVAFAQSICEVYPETSVLSIDMVRCADTNRLYCLEVNLGNLCVLSAPLCSSLRRDLGADSIHMQFNSYDTIARKMIEKLRNGVSGCRA